MLLNKLFDIVVDGPKNKIWYIIYIPAMLILSALVLFLLMGVIPELIAWAFACVVVLSCIFWVIIWPIIKIVELITGKKIL